MRPDAVIGMQQHFLEAAIYTQALVFSEILEECRQTFLQTLGHVDPLNFDGRSGVEEVMSKHEEILIQVAHIIVADADGRLSIACAI